MRTMSYSRPIAVLLVTLGAACLSCDGGSRGSGISTAQGNVSSVETALREGAPGGSRLARIFRWLRLESAASADAMLENITVAIEGTPVTGTTDADGRFRIGGRFEGDVSLLFQRTDDGLSARMALNVPAGGTMTLNDVRLDANSGRASAASVAVEFDGQVVQTDCAAGTITLVSTERSPSETDSYTLRVDGSSLEDRQGRPIACADLGAGTRVHVAGFVEDDGTFGQAVVQETD